MGEAPRRSIRANKGIGPIRYTPYTCERPSRAMSNYSGDDLDNAIIHNVSHDSSADLPAQLPNRFALPLIGSQQPLLPTSPPPGMQQSPPRMHMEHTSAHPDQPPPCDPLPIREQQGSDGSRIPGSDVLLPDQQVEETSTSADAQPSHSGSTTSQTDSVELPHPDKPRHTSEPPPTNRSQYRYLPRMVGLPPLARPLQPGFLQYRRAPEQSIPTQVQPLESVQPRCPTHEIPSSRLNTGVEVSTGIRDLDERVRALEKMLALRQRIRELERELAKEDRQELVEATAMSQSSSDFLGFAPSTTTSSGSGIEIQRGAAQPTNAHIHAHSHAPTSNGPVACVLDPQPLDLSAVLTAAHQQPTSRVHSGASIPYLAIAERNVLGDLQRVEAQQRPAGIHSMFQPKQAAPIRSALANVPGSTLEPPGNGRTAALVEPSTGHEPPLRREAQLNMTYSHTNRHNQRAGEAMQPTIPAPTLSARPPPLRFPANTNSQPVAAYYVNAYNAAAAADMSSSQTYAGGMTAGTGDSRRPCPAAQQTPHGATALEAHPSQYDRMYLPDMRLMSSRRLLDLPQFGGRPEDWPHFICSYEATTQQCGYNDLENMGRLQKALVGEAKLRVQGILIRPEHVGRTVETLAKAFGRPEMLVDSQLAEIQSLPKINEGQFEQLIAFSITVENLVSLLDGPATQHLLENSILLRELTAKLPITERRSWAAVSRFLGPNPSVREFAKWLADIADDVSTMRINSNPDSSSNRTRDPKPGPARGKHVLLNVSNRHVENCEFCGEAHRIDLCGAFGKLTVIERLSEVRKRPLCYYCLSDNHLLPGCEQRKACGLDGCDRRHHRLLHQPRDTNRTQASSSSRAGVDRCSPVQMQPDAVNERQSTRETRAVQSNEPQRPQRSDASQSQPNSADPIQPTVGGRNEQNVENSSQVSTVLNCQGGKPKQMLYYRVVPVTLHGPNQDLQSYAILDEGSSVSLVDADLAEQLQLEGKEKTLNLQFASGSTTTQPSREVKLGISGVGSDALRFDIHTVQTARDLSLPVQTVDRNDVVAYNPHLVDVPFDSYENVRPKILLGLEHHYLGVPLETRLSKRLSGITAARTRLGWVLYGSSGRSSLPGAVVLHARQPDPTDDVERLDLLHSLVRQHFTTEDFGIKVPIGIIQSDDDIRASMILETTTKRIGSHFETGLLWKYDDVVLPDSYSMALNRLRSVEAKMLRNPEYARQYRDQIYAYEAKGYARKMSPDEVARRGPRTWYLPHFAVQSASKPGKFRLVFDAAATVNNISLNTKLLAGPDMNVPLTRLLFRFRLGEVGVCADVKEMYHQVLIRKMDQDSQRFLWRDGNARLEPSVYVMVAMTFGSTCSPTSAQFVKNKNAQEFAEEFPEAADAIQKNHYVDDYVSSFQTTEDAQRITAQVIELHKRGGFELRGVVSNCPLVRARFGYETGTKQSVSLEPEDLTQKILGMTWETEDDAFVFQTRFHRVRTDVMDGSRRPTKREMLSVAMSIFDPFGLLADFLLPTKTMLQELWRLGVQWDDPVPDQINDRWQAWRAQLENTRRVRIPRCYSRSIMHTPNLQLHIFADASEEAFAAAAYWRIEEPNGIKLAFIAGKVRCAPLKLLSIPRLELQAAVLATRLMLEIRHSHEELVITRTVFWSDSETVIKWLRCDQRRYVPFVAHRVAEVVESAPAEGWRWVPTAQNLADDATRVKTPIAFDHESRWLHGPKWLKDEEVTWPVQPTRSYPADDSTEELRPRFVGFISQRGAVDYARFSKLTHLIRVVAFVRRFTWNLRQPHARMEGGISAREMESSLEAICRLVQTEEYAEEVVALRSGTPVNSRSSIYLLKPYLDEEGLLRLHGRTDAARPEFVSNAAKRPIIMPRKHHVTMLIVKHHHELLAHQLTGATMASVRTKFWVPQLRSTVNIVRRACQTCRVRAAIPQPPMQGQLPPDRLNAYARPFTNTGVDYFGPYNVTIGRRREKRWVALFTCMAIRAVHLEVAADLSTDSFIMCLRNFFNLRGMPSMIRCDNGTNFVGARNELAKDVRLIDPEAVQSELSIRGIEWRFNCPGNPEAGGAWERLVQSVKRVLNVTLREEAPRVETFRALLLAAANMVNSRPLTHLQVVPDDPEPLTPNHFLLGGPNSATVPNPEDVEPTATRRQWRICRGLSRRFWGQFVRDYLPELTRRSRHYPDEPPLRVGDIVLICDENQPRGSWQKGMISDVVIAKDGAVRTATVRTARGELRRPATRLARIDLSPSNGGDVRGAVSLTGAGSL